MELILSICLPFLAIVAFAVVVALIIFRSAIIRRIHKEHYTENLDFAETELVKAAKPLKRTFLFGSALYVPAGVNAVTEGASPRIKKLYGQGDYIINDFFKTVLYFKYVDIKVRNISILVVDAPTKDGFKISVWMKLSFQVTDPIAVTNMDEPVDELILLVENGVRDTTIRYDHKELVPKPDLLPVSNSELVREIRRELAFNSNRAHGMVSNVVALMRGISIHSLSIYERVADPNYKDFPKGPSEAEKAVKEAENRKKVAEIENQIRLQRAKAKAQEDEALDAIRERELDRTLRREKPRMELGREQTRVRAQIVSFLPLLNIFVQNLQSPPSNRMIYSQSVTHLRRSLEDLAKSVLGESEVNKKENQNKPRPPENAKEKLTYQLVDLWSLRDFVGIKFYEDANADFGMMIQLKAKYAALIFSVSGVEPKLITIGLINSRGHKHKLKNVEPYLELTVVEILQKLEKKYGPGKKLLSDGRNWE